MKAIVLLTIFLIAGCATRPCTTIINGENDIGFGDKLNYDQAFILALDGKQLGDSVLHVGTYAGRHRILVKVCWMRGNFLKPLEAEIPVDAVFEANRVYNIKGRFFPGDIMWASLYTDEYSNLIGSFDSKGLVQ